MPSMQVCLDNALKDKEFGQTNEQKKALDALLAAKSTDSNDIEKAMSEHTDVWEQFNTNKEKNEIIDFTMLYQLATEKKIMTALARASVKQLIDIINADSLEKVNENFRTGSGKSILGEHAEQIIKNKGIELTSLEQIQQKAIYPLIIKLLKKATSKERSDFITRCNEGNIENVLGILNIEPQTIKLKIIERINTLFSGDKLNFFFKKYALRAANININKLDLAMLNDRNGEKLNDVYKELVPDGSLLEANKIEILKSLLSQIFVKNKISDISDNDLLNKIVSTEDNNELSEHLNKAFTLSEPYMLKIGDDLGKQLREIAAAQLLTNQASSNNDESKDHDNNVASDPKPIQQTINNSSNASQTTYQELQKRLKKYQDDFNKMDKNYNAIIASDKSLQSELKNLACLKGIEWFNPAFQGLAAKRANKLGDAFKTLSNDCDFIIEEFESQMAVLDKQFASLASISDLFQPKTDSTKMQLQQQQAFSDYRDQLHNRLEDLQNGWRLYKNLQDILKGNDKATNPLLKQGLVKTLEDAQKNDSDVKILPFRCATEDFKYTQVAWDACFNNNRDIKLSIDKAAVSSPPKINTTIVNKAINDETIKSNGQKYELVKRVATDSFRQYTVTETVNGTEVAGQFLEQRLPASTNKNQLNHSSDTTSHMKITINKFPPADKSAARVIFSLAVASQYLAAHGRPTKENPIILNGSDDGDLDSIDEMRYLYAAFMAIKKNDPYMNFDEKAIEVTGHFKPNREYTWWNKNNLYEKEFKNNPKLGIMMSGIKAINKAKSDNPDAYDSVYDDGKKITDTFKQRLNKQTLIENRPAIDQPNDEQAPTPTTSSHK